MIKNIGSIHSTKEILAQEGFRIKKHLGQNFLVDANILQKIVTEAGVGPETDIIEIGPGFGALTELLISRGKRVLAYEIDAELIPILRRNFLPNNRFILVNQDILDAVIDEDIERYLPGAGQVLVIANLPYYITTPILMRFLETSRRVEKLVIMMQAEVAERVTSKPDTKDYNALSVVINYRAKTKVLFQVPRTVFVPPPNVDSSVVEVLLRETPIQRPKDEAFFFTLVHQCFVQRRKTLINNLRQAFPDWTRDAIERLLVRCHLNLNVRAEALDISDFIRLSDEIIKNEQVFEAEGRP